ncbi:IclR family transcriptional regulator [Parapusillimonas granuli]|uniref:IclR family transcriptional regulator n=1 Tax=Parapusillimonas granuli TaxID=380911 RepID=UPI0017C96E22|nr:DNA-binding IclR family transcriptional regulator [Parapusillimonas granuli]MEB2401311.1 IclR family transcriptional regulator [Alcaligenaceae bacterium]
MISVPPLDNDEENNGTAAPDGAATRALRILLAVSSRGRAMALSEITEELDIPKGTAHRLCAQLVSMGFLARDVDERSYGIGKSLRRLALNTLNHRSVQALRHDVLIELVKQVGETCNFTTLDGTQVVYLDRVEAQWPLRLIFDVGSHVPLHCTASGKLLLAHMPPREAARVLPHLKLDAKTPSTITSLLDLERECRLIREQGYSTDREEFIAGMVAVAVPARDSRGDVRAVVAMHAPTARMSIERAIELLPYLNKAAREMQGLL